MKDQGNQSRNKILKKDVSEGASENISKKQELEAKTISLETAVEETDKTTTDHSGDINTLKEDLRDRSCCQIQRDSM